MRNGGGSRPLNSVVRRHRNVEMRTIVFLGIAGLTLGILGGFFGGPMWLAAGSFVFGAAMLGACGYAYWNSESAQVIEPYDIGEEPPSIAPASAEQELRRKDRGTVLQRRDGAS